MFSHGLGIVSPDGELGHLPFFGGFAGGAESSVIPWTDLFKSLTEARSLPRLLALSPLCCLLPSFFLSVMTASSLCCVLIFEICLATSFALAKSIAGAKEQGREGSHGLLGEGATGAY